MWGLLTKFWENQELVTRQNGYHSTNFRATCGTTQVGVASPTLFKVAVDSVVCHWISLTVEDREVLQDGPGNAVVWSLVMFYADYGLLGSWDPECMQGNLQNLI